MPIFFRTWIEGYRASKNINFQTTILDKILDKFSKLSIIGFLWDGFTAAILRFFTEKRQNVAFRWPAGYFPSNPSLSWVFLKFSNFLRSSP